MDREAYYTGNLQDFETVQRVAIKRGIEKRCAPTSDNLTKIMDRAKKSERQFLCPLRF
jgi:hypothetical protein